MTKLIALILTAAVLIAAGCTPTRSTISANPSYDGVQTRPYYTGGR